MSIFSRLTAKKELVWALTKVKETVLNELQTQEMGQENFHWNFVLIFSTSPFLQRYQYRYLNESKLNMLFNNKIHWRSIPSDDDVIHCSKIEICSNLSFSCNFRKSRNDDALIKFFCMQLRVEWGVTGKGVQHIWFLPHYTFMSQLPLKFL